MKKKLVSILLSGALLASSLLAAFTVVAAGNTAPVGETAVPAVTAAPAEETAAPAEAAPAEVAAPEAAPAEVAAPVTAAAPEAATVAADVPMPTAGGDVPTFVKDGTNYQVDVLEDFSDKGNDYLQYCGGGVGDPTTSSSPYTVENQAAKLTFPLNAGIYNGFAIPVTYPEKGLSGTSGLYFEMTTSPNVTVGSTVSQNSRIAVSRGDTDSFPPAFNWSNGASLKSYTLDVNGTTDASGHHYIMLLPWTDVASMDSGSGTLNVRFSFNIGAFGLTGASTRVGETVTIDNIGAYKEVTEGPTVTDTLGQRVINLDAADSAKLASMTGDNKLVFDNKSANHGKAHYVFPSDPHNDADSWTSVFALPWNTTSLPVSSFDTANGGVKFMVESNNKALISLITAGNAQCALNTTPAHGLFTNNTTPFSAAKNQSLITVTPKGDNAVECKISFSAFAQSASTDFSNKSHYLMFSANTSAQGAGTIVAGDWINLYDVEVYGASAKTEVSEEPETTSLHVGTNGGGAVTAAVEGKDARTVSHLTDANLQVVNGSTVTLTTTAVEGKTFEGWFNGSSLSSDPLETALSYTVKPGDTDIVAVFKDVYTVTEDYSAYDDSNVTVTVAEGASVELSAKDYLASKNLNFRSWNLDADNAKLAAIAEGNQLTAEWDVTVTPTYEAATGITIKATSDADVEITVAAKNGQSAKGTLSGIAEKADVTLTAPPVSNDSKQFAYWKHGDNIISYEKTLKVKAFTTTAYTAVYEDAGSSVTQKSTLNVYSVTNYKSESEKKIVAVFEWYISDGDLETHGNIGDITIKVKATNTREDLSMNFKDYNIKYRFGYYVLTAHYSDEALPANLEFEVSVVGATAAKVTATVTNSVN